MHSSAPVFHRLALAPATCRQMLLVGAAALCLGLFAGPADARSKIKSKWKKTIRDKLRIDITIPWEQHQKLHHADMDRLVRYPGDYHPDAVTVAECFCQENWPKLRKRLRKLRSDKAARPTTA